MTTTAEPTTTDWSVWNNTPAGVGDGSTIAVTAPATGEVLTSVRAATVQDVDAAVETATRAQKEWAALTYDKRAAVLRRAAQLLEADPDRVRKRLIPESGSGFGKASFEVSAVIGELNDVSRWPRTRTGTVALEHASASTVPARSARSGRGDFPSTSLPCSRSDRWPALAVVVTLSFSSRDPASPMLWRPGPGSTLSTEAGPPEASAGSPWRRRGRRSHRRRPSASVYFLYRFYRCRTGDRGGRGASPLRRRFISSSAATMPFGHARTLTSRQQPRPARGDRSFIRVKFA